jgi:hypothetical protein
VNAKAEKTTAAAISSLRLNPYRFMTLTRLVGDRRRALRCAPGEWRVDHPTFQYRKYFARNALRNGWTKTDTRRNSAGVWHGQHAGRFCSEDPHGWQDDLNGL